MLFSLISIIIPYLPIYSKSYPLKIQRPNSNFQLEKFHYFIRLNIIFVNKYRYCIFVHLFISIIKIQLFKTRFPNLIFRLKKISPFIFIHLNIIFVIIIINSTFLLKIPIIRVQLFKDPTFKLNFQNPTIHYSSVQISF